MGENIGNKDGIPPPNLKGSSGNKEGIGRDVAYMINYKKY